MPPAWRCRARRSSGPPPGCATGTPRRGPAGWPGSPPPAAPGLPPAEAREGGAPPAASLMRVYSRSVACQGWGPSRCGPCMLPAVCAGPWLWTKLSPPSASSAAVTTYSCSAVRGAVGVCVAAGLRGRVSRQGTWGSSCTGHGASGPMLTAATVAASAVRSVGLYCLSPVVSRARCLQAAVQATAPQFVRSSSAPSALLLPPCCTVVAVSSGGPCCSSSGLCPSGRAGGAGCTKLCAPRRSGCVWYRFCRRCSGAARGRKRSCCRYQWPCAVDGLWCVNHCSTTAPGCAASTRRCNHLVIYC